MQAGRQAQTTLLPQRGRLLDLPTHRLRAQEAAHQVEQAKHRARDGVGQLEVGRCVQAQHACDADTSARRGQQAARASQLARACVAYSFCVTVRGLAPMAGVDEALVAPVWQRCTGSGALQAQACATSSAPQGSSALPCHQPMCSPNATKTLRLRKICMTNQKNLPASVMKPMLRQPGAVWGGGDGALGMRAAVQQTAGAAHLSRQKPPLHRLSEPCPGPAAKTVTQHMRLTRSRR